MPPQEVLFAENQTLKAEVAQLKVQIEWLKRKIFSGGQSETLDREQLMLALGQLEALGMPRVQADRQLAVVQDREVRGGVVGFLPSA